MFSMFFLVLCFLQAHLVFQNFNVIRVQLNPTNILSGTVLSQAARQLTLRSWSQNTWLFQKVRPEGSLSKLGLVGRTSVSLSQPTRKNKQTMCGLKRRRWNALGVRFMQRSLWVAIMQVLPELGFQIQADPDTQMTCAKCRQHFCYRCGTKLPGSDPYKHFSTTGQPCYNKLFDFQAENEEWQPIEGFEIHQIYSRVLHRGYHSDQQLRILNNMSIICLLQVHTVCLSKPWYVRRRYELKARAVCFFPSPIPA